jgi:hypothetical protein
MNHSHRARQLPTNFEHASQVIHAGLKYKQHGPATLFDSARIASPQISYAYVRAIDWVIDMIYQRLRDITVRLQLQFGQSPQKTLRVVDISDTILHDALCINAGQMAHDTRFKICQNCGLDPSNALDSHLHEQGPFLEIMGVFL